MSFIEKIDRNNPTPCESRKKYKHRQNNIKKIPKY